MDTNEWKPKHGSLGMFPFFFFFLPVFHSPFYVCSWVKLLVFISRCFGISEQIVLQINK